MSRDAKQNFELISGYPKGEEGIMWARRNTHAYARLSDAESLPMGAQQREAVRRLKAIGGMYQHMVTFIEKTPGQGDWFIALVPFAGMPGATSKSARRAQEGQEILEVIGKLSERSDHWRNSPPDVPQDVFTVEETERIFENAVRYLPSATAQRGI